MKSLRVVFRWFRVRLMQIIFFFLTPLLKIFCHRVFLSYNHKKINDGVGAQVQRIISIAGLAKFINAGYLHREILDITTHPMDPFQDAESRNKFISNLNSCVKAKRNSTINYQVTKRTEITRLDILTLLLFGIVSTFSRKTIELCVSEVYSIVDLRPSIYLLHRYFLDVDFSQHNELPSQDRAIYLHYRRGTGGMALFHGQNSPRELSSEYFKQTLMMIMAKSRVEFTDLVVLTDSPLTDTLYEINPDQIYLWEKTPGYKDGYLSIEGKDIASDFSDLSLNVSVVVGGDPLSSLGALQKAEYFVMSKSSFSYVAAILNANGNIYYPREFWHPKMRRWKRC